MSKPNYVKIEKDGLDGTCLRIPSTIRMWERNGWTVVDDEVEVKDEPKGEPRVITDPQPQNVRPAAQQSGPRPGPNALTSTDDKN